MKGFQGQDVVCPIPSIEALKPYTSLFIIANIQMYLYINNESQKWNKKPQIQSSKILWIFFDNLQGLDINKAKRKFLKFGVHDNFFHLNSLIPPSLHTKSRLTNIYRPPPKPPRCLDLTNLSWTHIYIWNQTSLHCYRFQYLSATIFILFILIYVIFIL